MREVCRRDKMYRISSTLLLKKHDGVLELRHHDVKTVCIPLHIWASSRVALVDNIQVEGKTVLFMQKDWCVSVFKFYEKQFMCFSKLDRSHVRRGDMSINISLFEYDEICRILDHALTEKVVTGLPVYVWKYIDYKKKVQLESPVRFLNLDTCVDHGMNAESAVPDQYNNPPCEMKVFVDIVFD